MLRGRAGEKNQNQLIATKNTKEKQKYFLGFKTL